jgi:hypothetical protein
VGGHTVSWRAGNSLKPQNVFVEKSFVSKQRIGFARIFYVAASSENVFAVLDECSDAVSMEAGLFFFSVSLKIC